MQYAENQPPLTFIGQTKKQLKKRYFEHLNGYKKPEIYKSNLATHAINTGHEFPDITNVSLIKHICLLYTSRCV